ncbi:hypothetical protein T552_02511 [Pneumocystis carinii B80]|uniref:RIC1 C-terminal alpha solenoid region domain-containing protein n=1 Tax=Pneumocystis carinii (strain B80) TaxID=1408658 RepID=A0A0W4ZFC9_PNEC8|nr:hypothetical protein T552_02511 [Pneumocystis carinii B80]KTW27018.1 hypothetical protein T552_02511 [Pneumocystis carinii B80]
MYWPVGIPSVFQLKNDFLTGLEYTSVTRGETVLALKKFHNGTHFIVLTSRRIYVWQIRPTVLVSSITCSAISLTLYGENRDLFIMKDSEFAIIKTSLGFLLIYSIHKNLDQKLYKFHYSHNKTTVFDFLDLHGLTEYELLYLKFKSMIKVDSGLSCVLVLDDCLLFSTFNPPSVQFVSQKEFNHTITTSDNLAQMEWIEDKNVTINDMIYEKTMNIYIWITSNSKAYLVRKNPSVKSKNQENIRNWTGICFYVPETEENHIVKTDINTRLSLIAFGCKNGEIKMFYIEKSKNLISYLYTIILDDFNVTGNIESLLWSEDGFVIFVGFQNTWSLWSAYGNLLSSKPNVEDVSENSNEEIFMGGVSHALWFNEGAELIVVSNKEKSSGKLWKINMARSIRCFFLNPENSFNFILQVSDIFLIYKGYEESDIDIINPKQTHWKHVQIPLNYFYDNWTIMYTAISSCSQHLVIAGYYGMAYYNFKTERWKIIVKDTNYSFRVSGGMCWYQDVLIASVSINNTSYGLKLFSRKETIDNIQALSFIDIGMPIYLLTLISENLLLYTGNNLIMQYLIIMNDFKVKLVLVGSIDLKDIVYSPKSLRAFTWCFLSDQMQNGHFINNIHMASIILLVDDKLMFLKPKKNDSALKYDIYLLSEKVEYFLFIDHLSQYLRPSICAFCGTEIKIWMDFSNIIDDNDNQSSDECVLNLKNDRNLITIPLDFYPVFFLLNKGVILGIKNTVIQHKNMDFFSFRIDTMTTLFLPYILEKYLDRTTINESIILASKYQKLVYFNHILELLLYNVLEKGINCSEDYDPLLPKVAFFLKHFPKMLDIVASCARKIEVSFWKNLFSAVGTPKELFEKCMELDKLETATEYLIILHTIESTENMDKNIIRVLEKSVLLKKWKLCSELVRFSVSYDNEMILKKFILSFPQILGIQN